LNNSNLLFKYPFNFLKLFSFRVISLMSTPHIHTNNKFSCKIFSQFLLKWIANIFMTKSLSFVILLWRIHGKSKLVGRKSFYCKLLNCTRVHVSFSILVIFLLKLCLMMSFIIWWCWPKSMNTYRSEKRRKHWRETTHTLAIIF
jgi:hypothetical protein